MSLQRTKTPETSRRNSGSADSCRTRYAYRLSFLPVLFGFLASSAGIAINSVAQNLIYRTKESRGVALGYPRRRLQRWPGVSPGIMWF
jgi:hypothetical protein